MKKILLFLFIISSIGVFGQASSSDDQIKVSTSNPYHSTWRTLLPPFLVTSGNVGLDTTTNDGVATRYDLIGKANIADPLSQFAATTSAQLAGVISDETGTILAVFSNSPALTGVPTVPTASLATNTTQIATTAFVLANGGGDNLANTNLVLDEPRTHTLTSTNSLSFLGGQTAFGGSGATSSTDWFRGTNGSGDKMMTGHDDSRITFGKYTTKLEGNLLRHHFVGSSGRTSLNTLNFTGFVIENNVDANITLLSQANGKCTLSMSTASSQGSFIRCDFNTESFDFYNNGTYFMSNYDTELLTVMGSSTQNLSVADISTIGLLLKDIDLQLYVSESNSGTTLKHSPDLFFRSTYWNGAASVANNDFIHTIAINTSGDSKMIFNVGGSETFVINSDGNILLGGATGASTGAGTLSFLTTTIPTTNIANQFQIYGSDIVAGNRAFHVKNENGEVVKLFKGAAMTAADATLANAVIRIAELEAILSLLGLL